MELVPLQRWAQVYQEINTPRDGWQVDSSQHGNLHCLTTARFLTWLDVLASRQTAGCNIFPVRSQLELLKVMAEYFSEILLFHCVFCFKETNYSWKETGRASKSTTDTKALDLHLCPTAPTCPGTADFWRTMGRSLCQVSMCRTDTPVWEQATNG